MLHNSTYNPDILTCLANLSNDEVFTPPSVVNQMLDMLPAELFRSSTTTFLDPVSKSGVFLREIAKRLMAGLAEEIPDKQERANHIFTRQLFGLSITELTALISRRSVYCSKRADGRYSLCTDFKDNQGNIRYRSMEHTFTGGKCKYCGAAENVFGTNVRGDLESHAYEFIHTDNPEKLFPKMKFDVIIGNPPYQLSTAGSVQSQATPIYNLFVEKAKKLYPRYLCMITPARWLNGGFGLDKFRGEMLKENKISVLHDFLDANECFPGIDISGGVCYFLWEKDFHGECNVYTHRNGKCSIASRSLLIEGTETFIRENDAISILKKVRTFKEKSFLTIVSPRDPFGLNYYENGKEVMFKRYYDKPHENSIGIYYFGWLKEGIKYTDRQHITTLQTVVGKYKVMISKAYGERGAYPYFIIGKPFIARPGTCCNMTYLVIGEFDTKEEAENVCSYIRTRFFRFLVSLMKNTQNAYKKVYSFVPLQDFSHPWTDAMLYEKYGLSEDEIAFIESMIRPME